MCGIFCMLSTGSKQTKSETLIFEEYKLFEKSILRRGPNSSNVEFYQLPNCTILFASSVLWLQGKEITKQPVKNEDVVLIFNGDLFGGSLINEDLKHSLGDTRLFFDIISECSNNDSKILENVQGPYAFICLNISRKKISFGRDVYGRRSLLVGKNADEIIITSVAKKNTSFDFIELPSIGIFSIDIDTHKWKIFPWRRKNKNFSEKLSEVESFLGRNIFIEEVKFTEFKEFSAPDKLELKFLEEVVNLPINNIFDKLCNSSYFDKIINLKRLLQNSIRKRIVTQPKFCQNCLNKHKNCEHAMTGVLFSGGVDCAVLALLASEFIQKTRPIDLINVAFEKGGGYNTPDRLNGISTLNELQILCPEIKWNFVEVNVTRQELDSCRSERISDLIYPLKSVLDDSLGCALWFASRATAADYKSPCRTLLVGMGADELFGGYTRHRAAFKKRNWQGLHEILEEDWQNLPHRNLARDDRVVSDHGRQLRTPYLDEEVVEFVQNLNCWERTIPSDKLPQGIGEKLLLRCLAYHLGLKQAAVLKKRALQFGSRIANSKEKGHETAERLFV